MNLKEQFEEARNWVRNIIVKVIEIRGQKPYFGVIWPIFDQNLKCNAIGNFWLNPNFILVCINILYFYSFVRFKADLRFKNSVAVGSRIMLPKHNFVFF